MARACFGFLPAWTSVRTLDLKAALEEEVLSGMGFGEFGGLGITFGFTLGVDCGQGFTDGGAFGGGEPGLGDAWAVGRVWGFDGDDDEGVLVGDEFFEPGFEGECGWEGEA